MKAKKLFKKYMEMSSEETLKFDNEYNHLKGYDKLEEMKSEVEELFSWDAEYYLTEFDKNKDGIVFLSIINKQYVPLLIPEKLGDNVAPLESLEVIIKDSDFKKSFGEDKSPNQDDIVYFDKYVFYVKSVTLIYPNKEKCWNLILEKYRIYSKES